jgi:hypothetical protein
MNFEHTEDRRMLADSLNRFIASSTPSTRATASRSRPRLFSKEIFQPVRRTRRDRRAVQRSRWRLRRRRLRHRRGLRGAGPRPGGRAAAGRRDGRRSDLVRGRQRAAQKGLLGDIINGIDRRGLRARRSRHALRAHARGDAAAAQRRRLGAERRQGRGAARRAGDLFVVSARTSGASTTKPASRCSWSPPRRRACRCATARHRRRPCGRTHASTA